MPEHSEREAACSWAGADEDVHTSWPHCRCASTTWMFQEVKLCFRRFRRFIHSWDITEQVSQKAASIALRWRIKDTDWPGRVSDPAPTLSLTSCQTPGNAYKCWSMLCFHPGLRRYGTFQTVLRPPHTNTPSTHWTVLVLKSIELISDQMKEQQSKESIKALK